MSRIWRARPPKVDAPPPDEHLDFRKTLSPQELAILDEARPHTMVSDERLAANMDAVRYVIERDIPGSVVECGVWRGGSVLAMVRVMQASSATRDVYLFDTFEGMTQPTEYDTSPFGPPALTHWQDGPEKDRRPWESVFGQGVFNEEIVRTLLESSGYPPDLLHFVAGRVEDTLPDHAPGEIAVLRLDTDWYESTRHELEHLYPRLSPGGVLIIDDYGHWEGARRAVDEYFEAARPRPLLTRIDYTGRIAVKT